MSMKMEIEVGDAVNTLYGTGVVTLVEEEKVRVRLWRIPGKSIASTCVGYLERSCVLEKLPAASGMVTRAIVDGEERTVMIQSYSAEKESYEVTVLSEVAVADADANANADSARGARGARVSSLEERSENGGVFLGLFGNGGGGTGMDIPEYNKMTGSMSVVSVGRDFVHPSSCAKFYPLLEGLMVRADRAMAMTSSLVVRNKDKLTEVADRSAQWIEETTSTAMETTKKYTESMGTSLTETLEISISKDEAQAQLAEMYRIMKDEELTTLLENGRKRLKQLVDDDIPRATRLALEKSGISIDDDGMSSSDGDGDGDIDKGGNSNKSLAAVSREKALKALDDFFTGKQEETKEFVAVFDSLSQAARSDRTLLGIFGAVSEKTKGWQELSGLLVQTKSVHLFHESTQRLGARAAGLLSNLSSSTEEENSNANFRFQQWTRAFTEGDAAVAKLKSLELGDAVRSRLIGAIELRSNSEGGLDAILAGALSGGGRFNFNNTTDSNGNGISITSSENIQSTLSELSKKASGKTRDARESLLGVLSRKSKFRELAVGRVERVLVGMDGRLGADTWTRAEIAAATENTAELFAPIARRAQREIQKQLDVVEQLTTNLQKDQQQDQQQQQQQLTPSQIATAAVLSRTRKLVSGELSLADLTDEAVGMLNNDEVVKYGETLVAKGEHLLDSLENAKSNQMVGNVLQVVGDKTGLTKSAVIKTMENWDVHKILTETETVVKDAQARDQMISSATDAALDFVLKILPSLPVPPFDGVRDGLVYHLSNLSLEGFKVHKNDVTVEIAGVRNVPKTNKDDHDHNDDNYDHDEDDQPPSTSSSTEPSTEPSVDSVSGYMGSDDLLEDFGTRQPFTNKNKDTKDTNDTKNNVKPTELLIIDVQNISAILEGAVWKFEQTYMPYLSGSGTADVKLSKGNIRLMFELRKTPPEDGRESQPALCLHERTCTINSIDLTLNGEGRLVWIFNKLATYLKVPLKNYVTRQIVDMLSRRSGLLLRPLNRTLQPFWGLILKTSGLTLDDLQQLEETDLVDVTDESTLTKHQIELVWRERLPLGMHIKNNEKTGLVKVVNFPRGSQARKVAEDRHLDPQIFEKATVMAVNGTYYTPEFSTELMEALRDPSRPKSVLFRLQDNNKKDHNNNNKTTTTTTNKQQQQQQQHDNKKYQVKTLHIVEEDKPIGIQFHNLLDNMALQVSGLSETYDNVDIGDLLLSINGTHVYGKDGRELALQQFEQYGQTRPLTLCFSPSYYHKLLLQTSNDNNHNDNNNKDLNPADELCFDNVEIYNTTMNNNQIILKKFHEVAGVVESKGVMIGDYLVFVDGVPVGAGLRLLNVNKKKTNDNDINNDNDQPDHEASLDLKILQNNDSYPLTLTFARPSSETSRWTSTAAFSLETATVINVPILSRNDLGCSLVTGSKHFPDDVKVGSFHSVKGPFQKMIQTTNPTGVLNMAVESINGDVVPTYATKDMVTNVVRRVWKRTGKVEITLCDLKRRDWITKLASDQTNGQDDEPTSS